VLGTFLACQSGYGSEGLLSFMRILIAQKGNSSDFGSNHPNSGSRIAMIERVARQLGVDKRLDTIDVRYEQRRELRES
jgi:predicted Zn-dependent protease